MSLFNKVKTYPQYHDAHDMLIEIAKSEEAICKGYEYAFGANFDKFINGQPAEVKDAFVDIQNHEKDSIKNLRDSEVTTGVVEKDFQKFLTFYTNILAETYILRQAQEAAEERKKDMDNKKYILERERRKGQGDSFANAEISFQKSEKAFNDVRATLADVEGKFAVKKAENAKQNVLLFSELMLRIVKCRQELDKKNLQTAEAVTNSVGMFKQFNDPLIPKLKDRLAEWEKVTV